MSMNDIQNTANRLVELLNEKKFLEAQEELFDEKAESIEPEKFKDRSAIGKDAIMKKETQFLQFVKHWNHFEVSAPIVSQYHFSLRMITDVILQDDQAVRIDEIVVYQVKEGKIISEQFFYN